MSNGARKGQKGQGCVSAGEEGRRLGKQPQSEEQKGRCCPGHLPDPLTHTSTVPLTSPFLLTPHPRHTHKAPSPLPLPSSTFGLWPCPLPQPGHPPYLFSTLPSSFLPPKSRPGLSPTAAPPLPPPPTGPAPVLQASGLQGLGLQTGSCPQALAAFLGPRCLPGPCNQRSSRSSRSASLCLTVVIPPPPQAQPLPLLYETARAGCLGKGPQARGGAPSPGLLPQEGLRPHKTFACRPALALLPWPRL